MELDVWTEEMAKVVVPEINHGQSTIKVSPTGLACSCLKESVLRVLMF
jgi:hypothetical protein